MCIKKYLNVQIYFLQKKTETFLSIFDNNETLQKLGIVASGARNDIIQIALLKKNYLGKYTNLNDVNPTDETMRCIIDRLKSFIDSKNRKTFLVKILDLRYSTTDLMQIITPIEIVLYVYHTDGRDEIIINDERITPLKFLVIIFQSLLRFSRGFESHHSPYLNSKYLYTLFRTILDKQVDDMNPITTLNLAEKIRIIQSDFINILHRKVNSLTSGITKNERNELINSDGQPIFDDFMIRRVNVLANNDIIFQ